MFNYQNQNNNNQALLKNQQEQIHKSQMMFVMEKVWEAQNQPQLTQTLLYLGAQINEINKQMDQCVKTEGISQYDQQFMREVRDRCLKIKRNNQKILENMLNLKSRMSRIMHITINKDNSYQSEYNIVQERIRCKKLEIASKLQQLKNRQMIKKALRQGSEEQKMSEAKKQREAPLTVALTSLKEATQIINRELIEQRQQIKCLVKQLYDQDI